MEENNIFKFAPNELVQDAFICWLFNWINIKDDPENIKNIAKDFLVEIINDYKKNDNDKKKNITIEKVNSIQIIPQYKIDLDNYKIYNENEKNFFKKKDIKDLKKVSGRIDILLIVDKYVIIMEDKVNTNEHDFQLFQYKSAIENKISNYKKLRQENKKKFDKLNDVEKLLCDKEVITCYYKSFDECHIEYKKYIDSIFDRKRILEILENYSNIKNLYFLQYVNYLKQIEKFSNLDKNTNELPENEKVLRNNRIIDIKYLGLLKSLQECIEEDKNTTVWWGKSNEVHRDTWWCNIDIDLHVLNLETFREKAFLKINAYENDNIKIRLMMGKAVFEVEENEKIENDIKFIYEYNEDKNCIIARYQEKDKDYNKIKSKIFEKMETAGIIEKIKNILNLQNKYEINKGGNCGNYEMTIFTVKTYLKIDSENIKYKLKNVITGIIECLENYEINCKDLNNIKIRKSC